MENQEEQYNTNEELETNLDQTETIQEEYAPEYEDEDYKQVNQLNVPEEARDHFDGLGFDLQWVRIYDPDTQGKLDLKNIQVKENDQYTFVPRAEVPGLKKAMSSYFGEELDDGSHGLYVIGDLALAKFPKSRQLAKRKFLAQRTNSRSRAIVDDLRKNSLMPSSDRGEKIEIVQERPKARNVEFGQ
jgi:hypothetical protein